MSCLISTIAYLNWERNLAHELGIMHWQMKELVRKGIIKPGMSTEQAKKEYAQWSSNTH